MSNEFSNFINLKNGSLYTREVSNANNEFSIDYINNNLFCLILLHTKNKILISIDDKNKTISDKKFVIFLYKKQKLKLKSEEAFFLDIFYFQIDSFFTFKNKIDKANLKIENNKFYSYVNIFVGSNNYYKAIISLTSSIMFLSEESNLNYTLDIQYLLWDLVSLIEKEMFYIGYVSASKKLNDSDINSILSYIENKITESEQISIKNICDFTHISKATLMRKFNDQFHCSPMHFINTKRIEKAKKMIETTDLSISDIAFNLGYINVTTFNRNFKNIAKCNPKAYRLIFNKR